MAPQAMDPLSQLRDIHLPEAVSAWPPAPGWWFLALVVLGAISFAAYRALVHYRANRYRRLAMRRLGEIEQGHKNTRDYLQAINQLLKQTVLAAPDMQSAAGLTGEAWLGFLDRSGDTRQFSEGAGRILSEGPYAPSPSSAPAPDKAGNSREQLHRLVASWISNHDFNRGQRTC